MLLQPTCTGATGKEVAREMLGARRRWWFAPVLVPDFGVLPDVGDEEVGTFRGVEVDDLDTSSAQPVQTSGEVAGFANDDGAEAELADEATTVPARSKSADHDEVAVGSLASSTAEGVGFAVDRRVVLLDAAVVAGGDELALRAEMAAPMGMPPSERPSRASEGATASIGV